MSRIVVNVATDSWVSGQRRLCEAMAAQGEQTRIWTNLLPPLCPPHRVRGFVSGDADKCRPFAFKAYALKEAMDAGYTTLLWCDASIIPIKPLTPIWEAIERDGLWILRNGWSNSDWTADSAYQDLFPECWSPAHLAHATPEGVKLDRTDYDPLAAAREVNAKIPHAVGTVFGIDTKHANGALFLHEYFRLASTTRAFQGPWQNTAAGKVEGRNWDRPAGLCGPPTTLGHRHDQTAMSVIAWRLKYELDQTSGWLAYAGNETEQTIVVAKGIVG